MILIFFSPLQSKAFFTFEFISTCEHFQIFRFLIKQKILNLGFPLLHTRLVKADSVCPAVLFCKEIGCLFGRQAPTKESPLMLF